MLCLWRNAALACAVTVISLSWMCAATEGSLTRAPDSAVGAVPEVTAVELPAMDSRALAPDAQQLFQDVQLSPTLKTVIPPESALNLLPDSAPVSLPAGSTSDEPRRQDLVVPVPAMGAGWALAIGIGMYHFGSRALRLRR